MAPRISSPQNTQRERFFRRWRSFGRQNLSEVFTGILPVAVVDHDDPSEVEDIWGVTMSSRPTLNQFTGWLLVAPADKALYLLNASFGLADVEFATYPAGLAQLEATQFVAGASWDVMIHTGAHVMAWTPLAAHPLQISPFGDDNLPDAMNLNEGSITSEGRVLFFRMAGFPVHAVPLAAHPFVGEVRKLLTDPPSGAGANIRDVGYTTEFFEVGAPPLRIPPGRVLAFMAMEPSWSFWLSLRWYERIG